MRILLLAVVGAISACQDPCVTLAQRICACEKTPGERSACQLDNITNRQSSVTISNADRQVCEAKLNTCTCDKLDTNDLDACGFVPERPDGG